MTANGQIDDTLSKRFLWNAYNQTLRPMFRTDPALTWVYSTDSYRQANGSSANQLDFICGLTGVPVDCRVNSVVNTSTGSDLVIHAVGVDSTSASTVSMQTYVETGFANIPAAIYNGYPGLGYHSLVWLERGRGSNTQTWVGSNGGALTGAGISGSMLG